MPHDRPLQGIGISESPVVYNRATYKAHGRPVMESRASLPARTDQRGADYLRMPEPLFISFVMGRNLRPSTRVGPKSSRLVIKSLVCGSRSLTTVRETFTTIDGRWFSPPFAPFDRDGDQPFIEEGPAKGRVGCSEWEASLFNRSGAPSRRMQPPREDK
jgi:hypothetical protein